VRIFTWFDHLAISPSLMCHTSILHQRVRNNLKRL
jgi:hypothetical protein